MKKKIVVFAGIPSSGKSFQIEKLNTDPEHSVVIDVLKFQKCNDPYIANYTVYAETEKAIYNKKISTIFIENTFYKKYRRKMLIDVITTLCDGNSIEVEAELVYVKCSEEQYLKNYKKRFPERTETDEYIMNFYHVQMNDFEEITMSEKENGWSDVVILEK